jgi:hypothetical protein
MTNREFYTAVINANLNEEMTKFATDAIAKLDARNAHRSATLTPKQKENVELKKKISAVLTSEPMLASVIAEKCGLTVNKASALVKQIEGVSATDVKVKGGTRKGYYFAE